MSSFKWAGLAGLVLAGACQRPQPPGAGTGPVLEPARLGLADGACPQTGYAVLEPSSAVGRFPCALAVAGLEPDDELVELGSGEALRWRLASLEPPRGAYWNRLFNTLPAIREVIVFDARSAEGPEADLVGLVEAARRRGAGLLLVWGPAETSGDYAALHGVIMDTASGQVVAAVRAQAGPADAQPPRAQRPEQDLRHCDVNELAAREFERQVRLCVGELVRRDHPPAATQPSPWQGHRGQPIPPIYIVPEPAW